MERCAKKSATISIISCKRTLKVPLRQMVTIFLNCISPNEPWSHVGGQVFSVLALNSEDLSSNLTVY